MDKVINHPVAQKITLWVIALLAVLFVFGVVFGNNGDGCRVGGETTAADCGY